MNESEVDDAAVRIFLTPTGCERCEVKALLLDRSGRRPYVNFAISNELRVETFHERRDGEVLPCEHSYFHFSKLYGE